MNLLFDVRRFGLIVAAGLLVVTMSTAPLLAADNNGTSNYASANSTYKSGKKTAVTRKHKSKKNTAEESKTGLSNMPGYRPDAAHGGGY